MPPRRASGKADRLNVVSARSLPPGWTGKLWALAEGVRTLEEGSPPDLFLFTDADIAHHPRDRCGAGRVCSKGAGCDLVSLMVLLRCRERGRALARPGLRVLLRHALSLRLGERSAAADGRGGGRLHAACGAAPIAASAAIEAIRGALIDDCALARAVKRSGGSLFLALTRETRSLRPYPRLADVWSMVARTAYTQLRPFAAAARRHGAGVGLDLPRAARSRARGRAGRWLAGGAWAAMAVAYAPMLRFYRLSPLWAPLLPAVAVIYLAATLEFGAAPLPRPRRRMEGTGAMAEPALSGVVETPSGKGRGDENFPVGSWLIRRDLRPHVHAFYRFAREADDIADNPQLSAADKVRRLDRMAAVLEGAPGKDAPAATAMRASLRATGVTAQHCLDVLTAFRLDATKLRYRDWDDLMAYCRYSAAPVGRQLLDLHGEQRSTWPPSDALCSALQVLNHLQDCGEDYRALDRVYLPERRACRLRCTRSTSSARRRRARACGRRSTACSTAPRG